MREQVLLMQTLSENEFQRNKITFGAISREERQYFSVQSTSGLPSIFIVPLSPGYLLPIHHHHHWMILLLFFFGVK